MKNDRALIYLACGARDLELAIKQVPKILALWLAGDPLDRDRGQGVPGAGSLLPEPTDQFGVRHIRLRARCHSARSLGQTACRQSRAGRA